jgi:hypothetical protein
MRITTEPAARLVHCNDEQERHARAPYAANFFDDGTHLWGRVIKENNVAPH